MTSGNEREDDKWEKTLACGEFQVGNGSAVICQVDLKNREKNPVANLLIKGLIG